MEKTNFDNVVPELRRNGMCCAQVMLHAGLTMRGEQNDQLVHAVRTLCTGMQQKKTCGAITGGAVMLGLWDSPKAGAMVRELNAWFEQEFGSTQCADLMAMRRENEKYSCNNLIRASIHKCQDMLEENL